MILQILIVLLFFFKKKRGFGQFVTLKDTVKSMLFYKGLKIKQGQKGRNHRIPGDSLFGKLPQRLEINRFLSLPDSKVKTWKSARCKTKVSGSLLKGYSIICDVSCPSQCLENSEL